MPGLQVPLQKIREIVPGDLLVFEKNASALATVMVGEVNLCSAAPVRVEARRAARVLSIENGPRTGGEM